jgi:16S rRNA processing protein RimM
LATSPEPEYLRIARIQKVQGRRGEVAAELWTDFPERFQPGEALWLSGEGLPEAVAEAVVLEQSWMHKGRIILKFRGVDTISAAETLVGRWVLVPRSARWPLPPGAVYLSDLVGCAVLEGEEVLGIVEGIEETGAVPLLKVNRDGRELLVPLARDICSSISPEKKEIRVRLPEGLQELNEPKASERNRGAGAGPCATSAPSDDAKQ